MNSEAAMSYENASSTVAPVPTQNTPNVTSFRKKDFPNATSGMGIWYTHLVSRTITTVLFIYLTIVTIRYEVTRHAGRKRSVRSSVPPQERKLALASRVLALVASAYGLALSVLQLLSLLLDKAEEFDLKALQSDRLCSVATHLRAWSMLSNGTAVYSFLWARQRVFYVNPALKHLNGIFLRIFSYFVLAFWVVYYIVSSVINFSFLKHTYIPGIGCVPRKEHHRYMIGYYTTWMACCSFMQGCLLLLFIYPILKRYFDNRHRDAGSRPVSQLYNRFKKATIMAAVCIGSDVFSYIVFYVISKRTFPIYNLNCCINTFSIVLCFDFWRKILFPCTSKKASQRVEPASKCAGSSSAKCATESTAATSGV